MKGLDGRHRARFVVVILLVGVALFIVAGVPGCASLKGLGNLVEKPRAQVTKAEVEKLNFEGAQIGVDVKITNPNAIGVSLSGFSYAFAVNGVSFITGDFTQGFSIAANGDSTVHVPVAFVYQKLISSIASLAGRNEAAYRIDLKFAFDVPVLGKVEVPITAEGKLPVVRVPDIKFTALTVKQLTLSGAVVAIRLDLRNPNIFALSLGTLDYAFSVNGSSWVSTRIDREVTVDPGSGATIEIPISLDFASTGRTLFSLLSSAAPVDYRFHGSMSVGTSLPLLSREVLPIELSGRVPITR
ncbi:MAG TPA: LEA type 2 family protein [Spirochaetia bacterium]|nr:LEA type 2 family protein [Spirochaetia bacterium]